MAEIRRIVRSNPKSSFRQQGAVGGGAFAALADIANTAYEFMLPAAENQLKTEGAEVGRELARMQAGNNRVPFAYPGGGVWSEGYSKALSGAGFDQDYIRAAQAVIGGESGGEFTAQEDHRYSPARAREIFPDVFGDMDDDQISALVGAGPQDFFETTYGAGTRRGQNLGNTQPGDGGTFRGRGPIQLTGRANYERYGAMTGYDLVNNPDLITSDPEVAAAVTAAYLQDRVKMTGDPVADVRGAVAGSRTGAGFTMNIDADRARFQNGSPAPAASAPAPTMVKTAEGNVEPRLYSPMSGPLLQVYNAAAGTAYMSQISLSAAQDFSAMHSQFLLNPEGFLDAARGYVDQVVEQAPDPFKADLRATLEEDMQQNYLGIVEDKQRDIRQRADNSSKALVDRRQKELAQAIAGGNPDTIASAEARLNGLLRARESLPGVAWTRAQSDNVILDAYDSAKKIENTRLKEYTKELGTKLDAIIAARENGQHSADEGILSDQSVWELQPEKAREAAAKVAISEVAPEFMSMPPAERAGVIEEERGRPITASWETDLLDAMEEMDGKANAALEKDPVKYFETYMPEGEKPPALPTDMADPTKLITALADRRSYMQGMVDAGYLSAPEYFSDAEIEALSPIFAAGGDPAVKATLATSFVQAFGADAGAALAEMKADDVTRHVGGLMAAGVSDAVAQRALTGKQMIDEGLVQLPPKAAAVDSFSPEIADALGAAGVGVQGALLSTAKALYASQARGVDPTSEDASDLMARSLQEALGYQEGRRGATGGVQQINGIDTLLPPGVSPERVEIGIRNAIDMPTRRDADGVQEGDPSIWGGNGVPSYNGQPLSSKVMEDARFVPITGPGGAIMTGMYRIELFGGTDVENEAGNIFIFDMRRLAEGVR